jgi:aldehyde dehydrogenase (NAD+)
MGITGNVGGAVAENLLAARKMVRGVGAQYRESQSLGRPSVELGNRRMTTPIPMAVGACYLNNGQACIAASRLIVPEDRLDEVKRLAKAAVEIIKVGDPMNNNFTLGPWPA